MTLREMKDKVLSMIEELNSQSELLTDDIDISEKINTVINQIQNELSRIKKIPARDMIEVQKDEEMDMSDIDKLFYQLNMIRGVKYQVLGNTIIFEEEGTASIFYYKYPKQITKETTDDYKFELSIDVLEIMPYGVAGDLLKSDISANYGRVYSDRYEAMKRELDPRYHTGSILIEGGIDEFL